MSWIEDILMQPYQKGNPAFDTVAGATQGVGDWIGGLLSGGEDAGPPPANNALGGTGGFGKGPKAPPPPPTPDQVAAMEALFASRGLPTEGVDQYFALPAEQQQALMKSILGKGAPKPKAGPVDREALIEAYPDLEAEIRTAPEASLTNLITKLIGEKYDRLKPDTSFKVDRAAVVKAHPELADVIGGMDDNDISAYIRDAMRYDREHPEMTQDGVQYKPRKGASVKIVQDDAFLRAGYKSGDTICVRIP